MYEIDGWQKSLENIYNNIYKITYDGVYYRRDIGVNDKGYRKTNYESKWLV